MKYRKQGHYTRDYKQGQRTNAAKSTNIPYSKEKLKGTKKYIIKSFVFCYNNYYLIYQEAKYSISY